MQCVFTSFITNKTFVSIKRWYFSNKRFYRKKHSIHQFCLLWNKRDVNTLLTDSIAKMITLPTLMSNNRGSQIRHFWHSGVPNYLKCWMLEHLKNSRYCNTREITAYFRANKKYHWPTDPYSMFYCALSYFCNDKDAKRNVQINQLWI